MTARLGMLACSLALLAGCAGVGDAGDGLQAVQLSAADAEGRPRTGLQCELSNDRGQWTVQVPGTVRVRASAQPLHLACRDAQGPQPAEDIAATDQRGQRARQAALRHAWIGVVGTVAFLGTPTASAGAVVYLAAGAAVAGGVAAAAQRGHDAAQGTGWAYPAQVQLRLPAR